MDRKEMTAAEIGDILQARVREMRNLEPGVRESLAMRAWEMVQQDIPWPIVLAASRASLGVGGPVLSAPPGLSTPPGSPGMATSTGATTSTGTFAGMGGPEMGREEDETQLDRALRSVDVGDLAQNPAPPARREVGRYDRERLSANTRQAIRMGRHARRWHEIRKVRNVLLNIDQGYLKRMLGGESDALNQEINALLRSWAPLVRERQQGGRPRSR